MLKDAIIRPINSPYASLAILVRKREGSWYRILAYGHLDYIELNSQTIKNKFPISVIEDLLHELYGAKIFPKLDLKSGYHQIRMEDSDIHKTTFRTYFGHFEFLVMPFGLTNAPTIFQALMSKIFASHLRKFILVFFDGILVHNKTMYDHYNHLSTVLQILRDNSLTVKRSAPLQHHK
jgi:hypothetical protein